MNSERDNQIAYAIAKQFAKKKAQIRNYHEGFVVARTVLRNGLSQGMSLSWRVVTRTFAWQLHQRCQMQVERDSVHAAVLRENLQCGFEVFGNDPENS